MSFLCLCLLVLHFSVMYHIMLISLDEILEMQLDLPDGVHTKGHS